MFANTLSPSDPMVNLHTSGKENGLKVGTLSVSVPKTKGNPVEVVLELNGQPPQFFVVSRAGWVRMMAEASKASAHAK